MVRFGTAAVRFGYDEKFGGSTVVNSRSKNCQIWNTPSPGIDTTNSCIESYNKQTKFVNTGYELSIY